ncbi:PspC domain-containing protein [Pyrococcus horikoshii]|nr:PspC domain-containing protein [Pyrococcus horikoshii]HII61873.1 PspC domain-containing protein [Pyrococcus horikoshii]
MEKRLYRARDERMFLGVLGGIAKYFDVDPTIVRLLFILLFVLNPEVATILYFGAALVMPEEPGEESGSIGDRVEEMVREVGEVFKGLKFKGKDEKVIGIAVIALGFILILRAYYPFINVPWKIVVGVLAVTFGAYLILRG